VWRTCSSLGNSYALGTLNNLGLRMTRNDLVAVSGRVGLTITAFALVVGIIAAPILPRFGSSAVAGSKRQNELTFRPLVTPAGFKTN
jgi:ABC-type spermidine/putrescine transport system permease subunit II